MTPHTHPLPPLRRTLLPLACATAFAGPALAPPALAAGEAQAPERTVQLAQAEATRHAVEIETRLRADTAAARVIKGAPFCADAVHETVQWLPDAGGGAPNRIVKQRTTRLCRDGEGRTRQELERGSRKLVYLDDPVARESWVLDPERKTARRGRDGLRIVTGVDQAFDDPSWRDYAERMREWAKSLAERMRHVVPGTPPAPPVPAAPPAPPTPPLAPSHTLAPAPATPVVVTRSDGGVQQVQVIRLQGGEGLPPSAEWGVPPPAVQWRAATLAPRGPGVTQPLPAREIEGLRANGERTTWTIPAGQIGNERPIEIVREVWTSPELMVTLQSRDFDPRSGETLYRLSNLRRGEPDAALMRVPPDYRTSSREPDRRDRGERGERGDRAEGGGERASGARR